MCFSCTFCLFCACVFFFFFFFVLFLFLFVSEVCCGLHDCRTLWTFLLTFLSSKSIFSSDSNHGIALYSL